jgi:serine/threonine-protein kinase
MELLEGRDLEAFVEQEGAVPEATLMDVIIPIVAGLTAVHDAGIVHRDLKPGNIFLTRGRNDEIEPKLLDFGISKSFSHGQRKLTSSKGLLMGTPFYMSPEASQGLDITPLADQYALGVVLYECATGANPFSGANTFAEVVRQVLTGQYPSVSSKNPRLSKRMVAIIERAMHLDPARRFPNMRAMGRELLLLAGQRTRVTWGLSFNEVAGGALARTASAPAGAVVRRSAKAPRFQRKYALSGALLGLAVLGSAWALWAPSRLMGEALATTSPPAVGADQVSAMGLRPRASDAPAVDPAVPVDPALAVATALAPEPALPPSLEPDREPALEPAALAPSQADLSEEPPALAGTTKPKPASARKAARARAPRPQRAASRKPVVEDVAEPDWVVSKGERSNSHLGPVRGTNNAPILE